MKRVSVSKKLSDINTIFKDKYELDPLTDKEA